MFSQRPELITQRWLLQRSCRVFMADVSCGLVVNAQQPTHKSIRSRVASLEPDVGREPTHSSGQKKKALKVRKKGKTHLKQHTFHRGLKRSTVLRSSFEVTSTSSQLPRRSRSARGPRGLAPIPGSSCSGALLHPWLWKTLRMISCCCSGELKTIQPWGCGGGVGRGQLYICRWFGGGGAEVRGGGLIAAQLSTPRTHWRDWRDWEMCSNPNLRGGVARAGLLQETTCSFLFSTTGLVL